MKSGAASSDRCGDTDLHPMYALVDCNNFYASCERVFNPAIRTRPAGLTPGGNGLSMSSGEVCMRCAACIRRPTRLADA